MPLYGISQAIGLIRSDNGGDGGSVLDCRCDNIRVGVSDNDDNDGGGGV